MARAKEVKRARAAKDVGGPCMCDRSACPWHANNETTSAAVASVAGRVLRGPTARDARAAMEAWRKAGIVDTGHTYELFMMARWHARVKAAVASALTQTVDKGRQAALANKIRRDIKKRRSTKAAR